MQEAGADRAYCELRLVPSIFGLHAATLAQRRDYPSPIVEHTKALDGQRARKGEPMKKADDAQIDDDLMPEYDLSRLKGRVVGKYTERYGEGTNIVLLEPDVAQYFRDAEAVNEALRSLVKIAQATTHTAK